MALQFIIRGDDIIQLLRAGAEIPFKKKEVQRVTK
jgi:hypothetical protein